MAAFFSTMLTKYIENTVSNILHPVYTNLALVFGALKPHTKSINTYAQPGYLHQ
jgi:hypothetical protein